MLLNKQTFDNIKNKSFFINFEQEQLTPCELIEIKEVNSQTLDKGQNTPFSLVFETKEDMVHQQDTYLVSNDELNETAMFLVPIGTDDNGVRYEAVFT